jgi:UDP-N-acetylmuramate dehydrogenase
MTALVVERDVPLAPRTTLGLGGPARRYVVVRDVESLGEALRTDDRVLVLGGGSNLVVGDAGWDGLVVHIAIPGVRIELDGDHATVTAGAGVVWDQLVAEVVGAGLAGLECLSGIPGLVGATPMQNVGAYGQEVADTITEVRALDRDAGRIVTFAPGECEFAYRTSMFKGSTRWVITEVQFRLARRATGAPVRYPELARALGADTAPLPTVRDTVIALRRTKGMVVDPGDPESKSAGSFFMNPIVDAAAVAAVEARLAPGLDMPRWPQPDGRVKLSAAWLIERAGFAKGHTAGRVGISTKHALALVNRGGTTAELLALARAIQAGVRATLGVELVPEPVVLAD